MYTTFTFQNGPKPYLVVLSWQLCWLQTKQQNKFFSFNNKKILIYFIYAFYEWKKVKHIQSNKIQTHLYTYYTNNKYHYEFDVKTHDGNWSKVKLLFFFESKHN